MNVPAPPEKREGTPAGSALPTSTFSQNGMSMERQRTLELLCAIIRSLTHLGDKLDDQTTLLQQQTDLLRRIMKERAL
jgi:hypothetical protein